MFLSFGEFPYFFSFLTFLSAFYLIFNSGNLSRLGFKMDRLVRVPSKAFLLFFLSK